MRTYDTVVVGAGPAGAATAREIARRGFDVLVLEEHREVGSPLHCSGLVTPRTLEQAGMPQSAILNTIRGGTLHTSPNLAPLSLGGNRDFAHVIDRVAFDRSLVEQAETTGAEFRRASKVVEIERDAGLVRLKIQHKGQSKTVRTRLLVGADGSQSMVRRWLGVEANIEKVVGFGAVARMPVRRADFVDVFFDRNLTPGFFAWAIPVGSGLVRLGLATAAGQPARHLDLLLSRFAADFEDCQILERYGGVIPLTLVKKPYGDQVMLVGDAAGQVKPTSGGGIYSSLIGAKHCAEAAIAALSRDDCSEAQLSSYATAWDRELGDEFAIMARLRRIFLGLGERELHFILRVLHLPIIRGVLANHGDIDFPSRALSRVLNLSPTLRSALT